jgi:hypothetical protein
MSTASRPVELNRKLTNKREKFTSKEAGRSQQAFRGMGSQKTPKTPRRYAQNEYLSLLLDPANAPLVGIPDQVTLKSSTFRSRRVSTITADAFGRAALAWSPALSNDLVIPTLTAAPILWDSTNGVRTSTVPAAQLASIDANYSDIRVVAASLTISYRGATQFDSGMYTVQTRPFNSGLELAGVTQDGVASYAEGVEAREACEYSVRDGSISYWFPEGYQSLDYYNCSTAPSPPGVAYESLTGFSQDATSCGPADGVGIPYFVVLVNGAEASSNVLELVLDVVYEAIPYMASQIPVTVSPANSAEVDQAANIVSMLPIGRSLAQTGTNNNKIYRAAAQSVGHLYDPSVHPKDASTGKSFWQKAKRWLGNVDWGNVATIAGEVISKIL